MPAYLDLPPNRPPGVNRSKTTAGSRPRTPAGVSRANTINTINTQASGSRTPQSSRFGSHFGGQAGGWNELGGSANGSNSASISEDDEDAVEEEEEREWGLSKGMELFEVSAKDDLGESFPRGRSALSNVC